jgi:hypothetical protein
MSLFYEALNKRVPGEFRATVNSLVAIFAPLMGLVLVPLVVRIRRETLQDAQQASAAG